MQIRIYDTPAQAGEAAALILAAQLIRRPDSVLGMATGSTPIPAYQALCRLYEAGLVDFSRATSFNLDEYIGIPEAHPCSYHRFMQEQLFSHVNLRPEAAHVPDGNAADLDAAARAYDEAIRAAGGIDVQILGIGRNGHIGFNEPGDEFVYGCHVVQLTPSTIEANKRFFDSEAEVPRQAISLGIGSIMNARQILLIATGEDKAQAVRDAVCGEVTPQLQASILRTHRDVLFLLDRGAASLLDRKGA